MKHLVDTITTLAEPLALSLGVTIWGVVVQAGPRSVIRVFAEGEEGISIDVCAELSRLLSLSLEVEDLFEGPYVLEVSSPGLERILFTKDQLISSINKDIHVTLFSPLENFPKRRKYTGKLLNVEEEAIAIEVDRLIENDSEKIVISVPYEKIKKANQIYMIPESNQSRKKTKK